MWGGVKNINILKKPLTCNNDSIKIKDGCLLNVSLLG